MKRYNILDGTHGNVLLEINEDSNGKYVLYEDAKELEDMLRHIHDVTDDDSHRMMIDALINKGE